MDTESRLTHMKKYCLRLRSARAWEPDCFKIPSDLNTATKQGSNLVTPGTDTPGMWTDNAEADVCGVLCPQVMCLYI